MYEEASGIGLPGASEASDDKEETKRDPMQQVPAQVLGNRAALETSKEYRAKYNLEETRILEDIDKSVVDANDAVQGGIGGYLASFFLTESELTGKPVQKKPPQQ